MKLQSINADQRLYVIHAGAGFTCYGFDVLQKRAAAVAVWAGVPAPTAAPGTVEHFEQCDSIMAAGTVRAAGRDRCPAELIPELIGLEGARVEVTAPGYKRRFYVGKSTGWLPCHLEIEQRNSHGGGAVYWPEGASVRVIKRSAR